MWRFSPMTHYQPSCHRGIGKIGGAQSVCILFIENLLFRNDEIHSYLGNT